MAGSSISPLQGSMGGTSTPYTYFPYGGDHIPPSSPLLDGTHQHSARSNVSYSSFGAGSQGLHTYSMPVGSTSFSLFESFGNNAFSSTVISAGGKPNYGQKHLVQGTIPAQGENLGIPSSQGPWNLLKGSIPSSGMPIWGIPFHSQWNPRQGSTPMPVGLEGGNHSQSPWNATQAHPFMSYFGSQSMKSQQAQNLYIGHNHGY
jgi:hypothetical protein